MCNTARICSLLKLMSPFVSFVEKYIDVICYIKLRTSTLSWVSGFVGSHARELLKIKDKSYYSMVWTAKLTHSTGSSRIYGIGVYVPSWELLFQRRSLPFIKTILSAFQRLWSKLRFSVFCSLQLLQYHKVTDSNILNVPNFLAPYVTVG